MMEKGKRLIDAVRFREVLDRYANAPHVTMQYSALSKMMRIAIDTCIELLDMQQSVDAVEVVHGRWIDNIDDNGILCNAWRKCSACGGLNYSKKPPYCPNCGAKMDGERKDND